MADRSAKVTWQGDLMSGNGEIHEVPSGAFGPLQVSWASRAEDEHGGKTSPEELIAAAHAACFAMALSVVAHVPGIDQASFRAAAEAAKDGCPVSSALKGNVELTLDARLVAE